MPDGEVGEAIIKKYFPSQKWDGFYAKGTGELKAIADYTGLNFNEIRELPFTEYLLYRRDSWITNMQQTEQGQEFLKTLWRLQQTEADINAVRKFNSERR